MSRDTIKSYNNSIVTCHVEVKYAMSKNKKEPIQTKDITRKEARLRLQAKEDPNGASPNEVTSTVNLLHELQVHQIELEMQQNELIVARDSCEAAAIRYQALYDFAPVAFFSLNHSGHITQTNLTAASMMGIPRAKVKGLRLAAYLTEDSLSQFNSHLSNVFKGLNQPACEIKLCFDNKVIIVQMMMNINDDGLECLTVLTDITVHKQTEVKLKLAASVFSNANEGIMITDTKGIIIEVNDTFTQITGYSRKEAIGQNTRILKSGCQSDDDYIDMCKTLKEQGYWSSEIWNRRKNGEIYPEMQSISTVRDVFGEAMHYVSMFTDITNLKAHQSELEHSAHHDILTGLPNRALLANKLTLALKKCQRHGKPLALAYIDLDDFKDINDTYGHSIGDQFLIDISTKFQHSLRAGDFLARIGGDEFIAVLSDLENISDCEQVLQRILTAAFQNIICNDNILKVSASIGVTLYPKNGSDPDLLLRQAAQAMYTAKDAGKGCYRFFDLGPSEADRTRRESLEHIRQGFEKKEFVLYYQPKVKMKTNEVVGAEALIRWKHPQQGILSPEDFLPIIEGHLISIKMGEWVIDTALKQISIWQTQGLTIPISVNVGASQLQSGNFVAHLAGALAAYPEISPELLELEILETSALEDVTQVSELMNTCVQMGVKFALDDFGTGYSSLTYLRRLPADILKIDQSFIRDMLTDTSDLAIVKAVIGLADIFNRGVIAEGVETKAHGEKLLSLNCDIAQGYGISPPMSADDFPLWLENWHINPIWTA
jgi:diguanylate cyclase (GGDEF)-like protein/PAS domain S-box-containing protein